MSEDNNRYFQKALSNFTYEMASGGQVRVMTDRGLTVKEISEKLDFPTPLSRISQEVWKRLIETEVILLQDPKELDEQSERISYVREYGDYGRASYRRIVEKVDRPKREYVACDFGRMKYKDAAEYDKKMKLLGEKDRDYVEGLPWPLTRVWHVKDERISRILDKIGRSEDDRTEKADDQGCSN